MTACPEQSSESEIRRIVKLADLLDQLLDRDRLVEHCIIERSLGRRRSTQIDLKGATHIPLRP